MYTGDRGSSNRIFFELIRLDHIVDLVGDGVSLSLRSELGESICHTIGGLDEGMEDLDGHILWLGVGTDVGLIGEVFDSRIERQKLSDSTDNSLIESCLRHDMEGMEREVKLRCSLHGGTRNSRIRKMTDSA